MDMAISKVRNEIKPISGRNIESLCILCIIVAGLGDLRNDNDPNLTYEGENNVLLQQSSNWLLAIRKSGYATFKTSSPLKSAEFLSNFDTLIGHKFHYSNSQEALEPESKRSIPVHWL